MLGQSRGGPRAMSEPGDEVVASRQHGKRPTMLDVAREAGVALRTVSRVVNSDPTVGRDVMTRVQAAVRALDYQPDERARQLRRGVTGLIGAAVRNLADAHLVLGAIDRAAREAKLTVLAMSTEDEEQLEREAVMSMCRRRVDGLIIEPISTNHEYLAPELAAGLPLVAVDRPTSGIAASGGVLDGMVHPGVVEPARVAHALDRILNGPRPATAILTGSADTTVEVLRYLGPRAADIALVGFDDFLLADLIRPALTVIAQDSATIGRTAIELLLARTKDPARPLETVTVPVELIPRGSGELPPPAGR